MRPVELLSLKGNLYWQRHDKQPDGTSRWTDRKVVGTGWHGYVSVFATGNYIYAIDPDGKLYWYRHDGQQIGTPRWVGRTLVGEGWRKFTSVFAVGNFIYGIDVNGMVWRSRHDGQEDGTARWSDEKLIAGFGSEVVSVFAAGDMLYNIASDGQLYRRRVEIMPDGTPNLQVANELISNDNWLMYKSVFAAHNGVIYGVGVDIMSWMSLIRPSRKLNEFTIPGTHDTGTWTLDNGNAKCQTLTLKEQLEAGIRFIDIRVVQSTHNGKPDFQIYHGMVNTRLWFSTDIVPVCRQFLHAHPTETIIMSVKDESGSTNDFETHLKLYLTADICLSKPAIPTLAEARGKIVLFRRYEYETTGTPAKMGIPAHRDWPPDERGFDLNTGHNIRS